MRKSEKQEKNWRKAISRGCFRVIYAAVKAVYPVMKVEGLENLPEGACLVVGNHSQIHGPVSGELYFPGAREIWCAAQMMSYKEVPGYAFEDFWSRKLRWTHPFYRLVSYVIAPLCVCIFNNAHTIPVYHDMRVLTTFRLSLDALLRDERVIIFPECYEPHNHIVNDFQNRFVDVARLYDRQTGKPLSFVPMYIAPRLRTMFLGRPIVYDPQADVEAERRRICEYLMDQITDIAVSLPRHRVVPYVNVSAKHHPFNVPEVKDNENTRG